MTRGRALAPRAVRPHRRGWILACAIVGLCQAPVAHAAPATTTAIVVLREGSWWLRTRDQDFEAKGPRAQLDQLRSLEGATLRIPGRPCGDSIRVSRFELLTAPDGLVPHVGTLIQDQGGTYLDDEQAGTRLRLDGPEAPGRTEHGARLWLTGLVSGPQTLTVLRWGVLEPAGADR